MELGLAILGGAIGGSVVLLLEQIVISIRESLKEKKSRIVKHANTERRITGDIFNQLGPGSSVELMKSDLGPPNRKSKELNTLFTEEGFCEVDAKDGIYPEMYFYQYFFKNAGVKIGSLDDETICSLTVIGHDNDIDLSSIVFWDGDGKEQLNIATITSEQIEDATVEEFPGCRDSFTAVHKPIFNPYWIYLTLFTFGVDYETGERDVCSNPKLMVGREINGICLSSNKETANYLFLNEHASSL